MHIHRDIKYTSFWARLLAWLVFVPPFDWIGRMQTHLSDAQIKLIFKEYGAQPISVGLILKGQKPSEWPHSIASTLGESK